MYKSPQQNSVRISEAIKHLAEFGNSGIIAINKLVIWIGYIHMIQLTS